MATNGEPSTTLSFTKELRELKQRLDCANHCGHHCYVSPINGDHIGLDLFKLMLWAKKIVRNCSSLISVLTVNQFLGDATYTTPPSALNFDHVPKKHRNATSESASLSTVPVPVHVHVTNDILSDHRGQCRLNDVGSVADPGHSISDSEDEHDLITYPAITEVLYEIHAIFPLLNMPQYESILLEHGVVYANAVLDLDINFFTDIIHMPRGVVMTFRRHATRLVRHAKKGKGKAIEVKDVGTENL